MKWFNPSKGFGFAQLDSGEDVFIHANLLKKHKLDTIEHNRRIRMSIRRTNFGYEAVDLIATLPPVFEIAVESTD
ncbi:MAG: cold shock domain-containing protein [Holosporaceae bacterium]|nr:cold shock domain-containing protein [Holosporaceae bacterium]